MRKTWFEKAKEHLKTAKTNYKFASYFTALEKAVLSAECALKAVLDKNQKLDLSSPRADKHHKIPTLFRKIKKEKCLPPDLLNKVENIIGNEKHGGLGYFKFYSSAKGIIDQCTSAQVVRYRYPCKWDDLSEDEKKFYAKQKIDEAEQLLNILAPVFYN